MTRSPASRPPTTGPVAYALVRQRWRGPSRSSAASEVTTLVVEASRNGCSACRASSDRVSAPSTGRTSNAKLFAGRPEPRRIAATAGGRALAEASRGGSVGRGSPRARFDDAVRPRRERRRHENDGEAERRGEEAPQRGASGRGARPALRARAGRRVGARVRQESHVGVRRASHVRGSALAAPSFRRVRGFRRATPPRSATGPRHRSRSTAWRAGRPRRRACAGSRGRGSRAAARARRRCSSRRARRSGAARRSAGGAATATTLSRTAASAGLTASRPGSKQNSRGTSTKTAPSARCPTTTGVPLNHDASHWRSTASFAAASVRCCAGVGGSAGGAGGAARLDRRRGRRRARAAARARARRAGPCSGVIARATLNPPARPWPSRRRAARWRRAARTRPRPRRAWSLPSSACRPRA